MHRSTLITILILSTLAGLLGWNYFTRPFERWQQQQAAEVLDAVPSPAPTPAPRSAYREWLASATTEQKVAQLIAYPVTLSPRANIASVSATLSTIQPGMVTWFGDRVTLASVSAARSSIAQVYQPSVPVPLFAVDHEGGRVQRLSGSGFTVLPSWRELCSRPEEESVALIASSAAELKTAGVDIVLAPMLDVASSSAVLGTRVCSGDPVIVGERASAWASTMIAADILPVFKHFPGIGKTTRDLHTSFDRVTVTPIDAALYTTILTSFPEAGVMTSHVGVTNQFPNLPCSLSADCVGQVSSNFAKVLIFSDALEMSAASYQPEGTALRLPEVSRRALEAGNHVLVYGPSVTSVELQEVIASLSVAYDTNVTMKNTIDTALDHFAGYRAQQELKLEQVGEENGQ